MPAKTWQQNMLGITFRYADGRITVFRSALSEYLLYHYDNDEQFDESEE